MPSFDTSPNVARTPFGKNSYLRSTRGLKFESYTFYKDGIPVQVIDGANQKVLQPGTALAKITSGPGAGMVGVFQAGVTDGRQTLANLVGIDDTFLPWQLLERDVEVAALYEGTPVQAWCFEYDAAGNRIPLTNATADALRGTKGLDITFK